MGLGDMVLVDFQTVLIPVALDACLSALAAGGLLQVALVMWLVSYELCVLIRRSWDSEMTWNLHLSSVFYKYGMLLTDQALLPSRRESGVIKMGSSIVRAQDQTLGKAWYRPILLVYNG